MYISELELQGFKSFAHKTRVKFDSGITAIVGPNGCGKSNIVDSMRWVLGEQRPTLLRSTSMANVIFNGTAQKKALGMAEVSLTFVNNKGLLPTEYNEVTISRRLYRSGESDYLINGIACRLKDINELFMDTGMGSDAYSVIELKMVEEILNDKNNDRRRLFEEAAGITGYKERRKKTFRRLEETTNDLQRVEDILAEVRKQTRSLEIQAEKAGKAKNYREELENLDKAVNRYQYLKIQAELEPLHERIENAGEEKEEIQQKAEELEQAEETARNVLNEKERKQAEAQRRVSQFQNTIRDAETELQITREKISNEKGVIEQYTRDIEQGEQDLEEMRDIFSSTKTKLESFDEELNRADENLENSRKKYTEVQQLFSKKRDRLANLEQEKEVAEKELAELQNKRIRIESRLENTGEELDRMEQEISGLEKEIDRLKTGQIARQDKAALARQEQDRLAEELDKGRASRKKLNSEREDLKDQIRTGMSSLDSIRSEIALLRDISSSNETFPSSVQFLLEEKKSHFDLLEALSDLLSTDEKHSVPLENVLGEALNFIAVKTLRDAREAAALLREGDKGRATFVPLDQLADSYRVEPGSLYHMVNCENRFDPLKQLLLGNVIVFDSVEEAYAGIRDSERNSIGVTLEGEVITSSQFLKSGSKGKNAGIRVGLKDKIEKLEGRAGQAEKEIREKEQELQKVEKQIDSIDLSEMEQALQKNQQAIHDLKQQIGSSDSKTEVYQKNVRDLKNRKIQLSEGEGHAREELKQIDPRREELNQKIELLENGQQEIRDELEQLEEERSIAQSRYNDAQLRHQDLKNKVENHEREIRRAESGIQSLKERLNHRSQRVEEARKRIETYKVSIEKLEKEALKAREAKKEADGSLKEAEEASARQRGQINEIEKELKEIRRRKEVNMELVHHLEMAREKFEMQAENLAEHIWETYEVLMEQITEELPEDKSTEEVKERISWLKQKLNQIGEVNPLAIEEFEKEKERLEFYEEQITDLQQAAEELRETINEINKKATDQFDQTFQQIRSNFQEVFHTLFNEDDFCDLVIDEETEDPLEARIEIKANPKGKRPSGISQLSGGEKTLTAIALLFAIYLVKPSPFCVLDEVDAPLDDANIERFASMIKRFSDRTQFIIITHNKKTMSKAEMMYGVTMPEIGISRLVGVQLDEIPAE